MNLSIKPEYRSYYQPKIREAPLTYISAGIFPDTGWFILAAGTDGELHSLKREHVRVLTKLEEALK